MKEIILSADSRCRIYSVPDEVADNLRQYCLEFCDWIWNDPNGAGLLKKHRHELTACFDETDFIDWLNKWRFPGQRSKLIRKTKFYDYEIPEEYRSLPRFNF